MGWSSARWRSLRANYWCQALPFGHFAHTCAISARIGRVTILMYHAGFFNGMMLEVHISQHSRAIFTRSSGIEYVSLRGYVSIWSKLF
jgi:hypothetical protein